MNKFGENLIRIRKENKISQQELAEKVNVSQQCVSEWEREKIEPTLSNLWKIADVFDISVDFLIGRKDY